MNLRRFLNDQHGSPSTEFAMLLPMLVVLLFVGTEAGHFVWTQHKLAEAVRDGARFASRLQIDKVCDGPTDVLTNGDHPAEYDDLRLLTRTGQVANSAINPVVPGWTAAQVRVTVDCQAFVDTGIYTDLRDRGPIITVAASNVTYPSMFNLLGRLSGSVQLNAKSSAAVIGI